MNKFEHIRNIKILEILASLKFTYIVLIGISCIGYLNFERTSEHIIFLLIAICFLSVFVIAYTKLLYCLINKNEYKIPICVTYAESVIMLIAFFIISYFTGKSNSSFKYASILIILISCIQYNGIASFITTSLVSLLILIFNFDKIYVIKYCALKLVPAFGSDLILIISLVIISFLLSKYKKVQECNRLQLQKLANSDGLTGLYNHRYFQQELDFYIKKSNDSGNELSLLFMDIDYFKNFNDVNGHQLGDLLLSKLGKILKSTIGSLGTVSRYGGEEFTVILFDKSKEDAVEIGELIRKRVENTYFAGQENHIGKKITLSIGVATYPSIAKSKQELINLADDALYRAKAFNKNRVEIYSDILKDIDDSIELSTKKSFKNLINAINIKDFYTYGHSERVVVHVKIFAEYLGLPSNDKNNIILAAYLHDIGKLEIKKELLNKKGKLTDEEISILKKHPILGVKKLAEIPELKDILPIILHHHERFDGTGYPGRLKGYEIPFLARMLTVADSFDAMTTKRPYSCKKTVNEAISELKKCSGTQFDSKIVDDFISMIEENILV